MPELFLEAFEPLRRSLICNQFCYAVREGCKSPVEVVAWVKDDAHRRGGHQNTEQQMDLLLDVIETPEALRFAQYIIARENLPHEQKAKIQAATREEHKLRFMKSKPPTRKQLSYLEGLGCHVIPENMLEASQLIDKYKNGNVPRPRQQTANDRA